MTSNWRVSNADETCRDSDSAYCPNIRLIRVVR